MKHVKLFEEYAPKEMRAPLFDAGENDKGKFVVCVVTEEAIDRFNTRYPGKPVSAKHIGYHILVDNYKEAKKKKEELESEGVYKNQKIKKVILFKENEMNESVNEEISGGQSLGVVNIHIDGNGWIKEVAISRVQEAMKGLQGERHIFVDNEELGVRGGSQRPIFGHKAGY